MSEEQIEKNIGGLTIRIDRTRCIGSGNCVKLAPQVFELDDTNLVRFVEAPQAGGRDELLEACRVCPVDALFALTRDGEQIVP